MTVKAQVRSYPAPLGNPVSKVDILILDRKAEVYWHLTCLHSYPVEPNQEAPDDFWSQIPEEVALAMYKALKSYYEPSIPEFGDEWRGGPGRITLMPSTGTDREDYLYERDRGDKLMESMQYLIKYWTENT